MIQIGKESFGFKYSRILDSSIIVQGDEYKLGGVIDHVGEYCDSGHYIAWKRMNSKWFKCDDMDIEEVDFSEIGSTDNYVLVFFRKFSPEDMNSYLSNKSSSEEGLKPATKSPELNSSLNPENEIPEITPMSVDQDLEWKTEGLKQASECSEINSSLKPMKENSKLIHQPVVQKNQDLEWKTVAGRERCKGCGGLFKRLNGHLSKMNKCKQFYEEEKMKNSEDLNSNLSSKRDNPVAKDTKKKVEKCKGCGNQYERIRMHLSHSKSCQMAYDLNEMKDSAKKKNTERMRIARANMSEEKKQNELKKNAEHRRKWRANMNEEETENELEKNAEHQRKRRANMNEEETENELENNAEHQRKRRANMNEEETENELEKNAEHQRKRRANMNKEERKNEVERNAEGKRKRTATMTEDEKRKERKKHNEAQRKYSERLMNDPLYNVNHAKKMAKYRERRYRKVNNTIHGRKRLFWERTRDGVIYPCMSCHRLLFDISVINVKDIIDFKDKVNGLKRGLFEETVGPDVGKIPLCRGEFYLCWTCRGHIFKGKIPPMSNQNDLESFDDSEFPELKLTELETSLIAKNILFMKIHKLPTSRMKAIKDRCVCVPIDEDTIKQTLQSLPKTPNEAGVTLVPMNWKRRKSDKGSHLQEWINVEKVFKVLKTLKNLGHEEYQFFDESEFQEFVERCQIEINQVVNELYEDEEMMER